MEKQPQFNEQKPINVEEKIKEIKEKLRLLISGKEIDLDIRKTDRKEISELLDSIADMVKNNKITPEEQDEISRYLYELGNKLSSSADTVPTDWSDPRKRDWTDEDRLRASFLGLSNKAADITTMVWRRKNKLPI